MLRRNELCGEWSSRVALGCAIGAAAMSPSTVQGRRPDPGRRGL